MNDLSGKQRSGFLWYNQSRLLLPNFSHSGISDIQAFVYAWQ